MSTINKVSINDVEYDIYGAGSAHVIKTSTDVVMPMRSYLKFESSEVEDDQENDTTIIRPIGGGGAVIKIGDVEGASAVSTPGTASVVLKWTDPEDIVVSGTTLAEWAGTKVIRKAGSAPTSVSDGTAVIDSTTKNAYSSSGYTDSGLTYGTTYYYRFFPYTTQGAVTDGSSVNATPDRAEIALPTYTGTLTYDGTAQTPADSAFVGYDSTTMTKSIDPGTNAGVYNAYFTPKEDYIWGDLKTQVTRAVSWMINKANGSVTLSSNSVTLDVDHTSVTVTASDATGELSVSSSDTSITTATISNGTITINSVNNKGGSATIAVSVADSSNYLAASASISVSASFGRYYGVEWDGTSTTLLSRTGAAENFTNPNPYYAGMSGSPSSPFDNISPWKDMVKVTRDGNSMVAIPKFYFKLEYKTGTTGLSLKILPSSEEATALANGYRVSPAHMDRGDGVGERDIIYVGRYKCADDSSNTWKSITGKPRKTNVAGLDGFATIHSTLGGDFYAFDFTTLQTIWMLYLVEFANWNTKRTIGFGFNTTDSSVVNGGTDSMPYHTGTIASSRSGKDKTQYRNIEGLFDGPYEYCAGSLGKGPDLGIYLTIKPSDFGSNDFSKYTKIGEGWAETDWNLIKQFKFNYSSNDNYKWAMYPVKSASDLTRPYSDDAADAYTTGCNCGIRTSNTYSVCMFANGGTAVFGLFSYVYQYYDAYPGMGFRIIELPNS